MLSAKTTNTVNLKPLLNIDMAPVLNDGAEIVRKDIRERFSKSIDVDGAALRPLKPETIEEKKRLLGKALAKRQSRKPSATNIPRFEQYGFDIETAPEKPLVRFGNLAGNQMIQRATKAVQRAVIYISRSGANYKGTPADKIYGFHHEGAGNLPSRRPFGLSDDARKKIAEAFHARIRRIVFSLGK